MMVGSYCNFCGEITLGGAHVCQAPSVKPAPTAAEPPPIRNELPAIQDLVQADIAERKHQGIAKYGTPLQAHNGRDALVDAYQEALDLCQYLRQAIYERDGQ